MFPLIGHAHPSFFRNADVTARLDVRPWPRAARWIARVVGGGTLSSGGDWQAQNLARSGHGREYSLYPFDWDTIEARIHAWQAQQNG